jgi:transketolase
VPWDVPFELPSEHQPRVGEGVFISSGQDAAVIAYGPVLLSSAYRAAMTLRERHRLSVAVINLPWLNAVAAPWLRRVVEPYEHIFALDNHHTIGGQADRIAAVLSEQSATRPRLHRLGIEDIPVCGTNQEVLAAHGLDTDSLVVRIRSILA